MLKCFYYIFRALHPQLYFQININDCIRKDVQKNILAPSMNIFNEAQEKIYILMKDDIFPRFLRDDSYLTLTRDNNNNNS